MCKPLHRDFLAAVRDLIHDHSGSGNESQLQQALVHGSSQLIDTVLCVTYNTAVFATAR
jgi:hypothetical protein